VIRRSWPTQLKASTTQEAVLTVVSQYLDEWKPEEIAALPRGAWPGTLQTKADVLAHALKLGAMHAAFVGQHRALAGLQELLLFFTHSSVRSNQLAALLAEANSALQKAPHKPLQRRSVGDDE
jgi:hypothetical protein